MQPILKLEEILWEITPKCNKNCKYCGSKDITKNEPLSDDQVLKIAERIVEYKVNEVTLTGGEPSTLSDELLSQVIEILDNSGCKVKIISNGGIFDKFIPWDKVYCIGLSVNFPSDYKEDHVVTTTEYCDNITIVTNFGSHNIWEFDKLAEIAKNFKLWQIQLTMGSEYQLLADGIKYLRDKIRSLKNVSYVLADNLQSEHTCSAGIRSCSILYNGDVITCLSERSYNSTGLYTWGNLLKESLANIWEPGFRNIRFGPCDRKCCRDFIEYPSDEKVETKKLVPEKVDGTTREILEKVVPITNPEDFGSEKDDTDPWSQPYEVSAYAVQPFTTSPSTIPRRRRWTSGGSNVMSYCVTSREEAESINTKKD